MDASSSSYVFGAMALFINIYTFWGFFLLKYIAKAIRIYKNISNSLLQTYPKTKINELHEGLGPAKIKHAAHSLMLVKLPQDAICT